MKKVLSALLLFLTIVSSVVAQEHRKYQSGNNIRRFQDAFQELSASEQEDIRKQILNYTQMLDNELENTSQYDEEKETVILELKKKAENTKILSEKYYILQKVCSEFSSVNFDSVYSYTQKQLEVAKQLGDKDKIAVSQADLSLCLASVSYYKEAYNIFNQIKLDGCSTDTHVHYLYVRFQMEFSDGFYFPWYMYEDDLAIEDMKRTRNEIAPLIDSDSEIMTQINLAIAFHEHRYSDGVLYAQKLLEMVDKNTIKYSEALGNAGYNYLGVGEYVKSMKYMVESAIIAIRYGSKNYPALRKIAETAYIVGDSEHGYTYDLLAMNNANSMNSKYRIIEAAKGLVPISTVMREKLEEQRNTMKNAIWGLSILSLLLLACIIFIIRQNRLIRFQDENLIKKNDELRLMNGEMAQLNDELKETHDITRILMSKIISADADRKALLKKLNKDIALLVKVKEYGRIEHVVTDFTNERMGLLPTIDEIILAFFPKFPEEFNNLMREDSKYDISDKNKLPTEVKIFGLWRLGIVKNEDIANCLGYSLNTIKSYKTHVMNSTDLDKQDFYNRLSKIELKV